MARRDVDPADKVRLAARSASDNELARRTYLAVHFDVLHARHLVCLLRAKRLHLCDSRRPSPALFRCSRADARYLECRRTVSIPAMNA